MILEVIALGLAIVPDTVVLAERIDVYDPVSMRFLGSERTWFDERGRRLRLEITDEQGATTLLFLVRHDSLGRESEAIYFEGDSPEPVRELFTYEESGRLKVTTYYYEPGVPADRVESELDSLGRELHKRYYRADGSQYGKEDVFWASDGDQEGWDFRYVGRTGEASFRFVYASWDDRGAWVRRTRSRDGTPDRIEVRTQVVVPGPGRYDSSLPFAEGRVSTAASESSPSFSADGRTMVFARYVDEWTEKTPHIASMTEHGWAVSPLTELGTVYNLGIAPDAQSIVFTTRAGDDTQLLRVSRLETGWSEPENLTVLYGLRGSYPALQESGSLIYYDEQGSEGAGIYVAGARGDGFASPEPLFVPDAGVAFDAHPAGNDGALLLTRCVDDTCRAGPVNGAWHIDPAHEAARRLARLGYVWGMQPVPPLGLLVFTDGDEIRAVPLRIALGR